jgi:hypothetical protein
MMGSVRKDVKWFSGVLIYGAHNNANSDHVCLSVCLQATVPQQLHGNLTKSNSSAMTLQVTLDPWWIKYHNMKEIFTHGTRQMSHQFHAPDALTKQPPASWVGTWVSFLCSTKIHFLVCLASSLAPTVNEVIRLRHDLGGHPKFTLTTWRKKQLMGWKSDGSGQNLR